MSFSSEWLKLREPADHRARNQDIFTHVKMHLAPLPSLNIIDIGCGTGSNLRAMALDLPQALQNWLLVDYDQVLLTAAKFELKTWATSFQETRDELHLKRAGRDIYVRFLTADLTQELENLLAMQPDLLTSAAFFDLCSSEFITRVAKACAANKTPLYTVLTYDGEENWSPPHALDAKRLAAFKKHQQTDKGFGKAAGFEATHALNLAFKAEGYTTFCAKSPWVIKQDEAEFIHALAKGAAQAAVETGELSTIEAQNWLLSHSKATQVMIGHDDFFTHIASA